MAGQMAQGTKKDGAESEIATPLKPHHIVPFLLHGRVRVPGRGENQCANLFDKLLSQQFAV